MPTSLISTFLRRPRQLLLRRMIFQVHLWAGLLLSLYVVILALTGSVLVFRDELRRAALPGRFASFVPGKEAPIQTVLDRFQTAYPGAAIQNLQLPSPLAPVFTLTAKLGARQISAIADPATGAVTLLGRTWLDWIYELHAYLLLGRAHGMQVNAVGAAILLLLSVTGIVLWWPGLKLWTRGLTIALSRNWRRVNFDLHSAIGFWTLALVCWWAFSGVYFGFYQKVSAAVAWVSPLQGMVAPATPKVPASTGRASLDQVLAAVHAAVPQGRLFSISDPALRGPIVYALVDLRAPGDFSHRDIVTLSTADAHILTVWHYGHNHTLGDWILWAMHPLHFGTLWGMWVKVIWALAGLSLALLSITGVVMYWNRWLRHKLP